MREALLQADAATKTSLRCPPPHHPQPARLLSPWEGVSVSTAHPPTVPVCTAEPLLQGIAAQRGEALSPPAPQQGRSSPIGTAGGEPWPRSPHLCSLVTGHPQCPAAASGGSQARLHIPRARSQNRTFPERRGRSPSPVLPVRRSQHTEPFTVSKGTDVICNREASSSMGASPKTMEILVASH